MDKHIVEKFFNDTCTVEEAEQVLEWLATKEGQKYLSERIEKDAELLKNKKVQPMLPALNGKKMWNDIEEKVDFTKKRKMPHYNHAKASSYGYAAAIVLLVCGLSFFFYSKFYFTDPVVKDQKPIHFITQAQERKELILSDGTEIILNSNSEIWISATYGNPKREVRLEGEAYFEVKHSAIKPFIIHTKDILIKDLGTAFNVRAIPGKENVQIAVKSGKVSIFRKKNQIQKTKVETNTVKLTRGQYAYVNLKTDAVSISEFEIKNYFSWLNDRLTFDKASLVKASEQLSHIYNVKFSYAVDSLKTMKFSAKFEAESLKRTLAVIALTLSIDYQMNNHHVIWKMKEK